MGKKKFLHEWSIWIVCNEHGHDTYIPLEPHEDGEYFDVILGFNLITTLENLKETFPVKRVVRVDDPYELTNPRIEYERKD